MPHRIKKPTPHPHTPTPKPAPSAPVAPWAHADRFGFFHAAVRGSVDAPKGASELADAILPQTLSTSPQCRDNSIATFFRQKCRNSNIATGARITNAPLMHAYQAEEDVITQYPKGVAIDQIERSLPSAPNRRTLQRWLNALMAERRIRREGHGRAVKY
jgi:hypothetical protein